MVKQDDVAIKVDNISKMFKLPHEKNNSIKGLFINMFRPKRTFEKQQVLKDVSFEIKKGEFFGIVGRNGSGKSTLLKLLAGIYSPDKGQVHVNGKLTPFIELGVGFNPELTGRENVFLNGALLGFSRSEMLAMYDEIVEFAELERFMDQKLKNYSSGMQVRLAFSIAIRANTDILVLDEVLAVGDEAFQRKCYIYFDRLKRDKKTVVLVTHDMSAVERFCTRAIFIEKGKIREIGNPHTIAAAYSRSNDEAFENKGEETASIDKKADDIDIKICGEDGKEKNNFKFNEVMQVTLSWKKSGVEFGGVAIYRESGEYVFGPSTYHDKYELKNTHKLTYRVRLNLGEGSYFIKAGLSGKDDLQRIAFVEDGPHFTVSRDYKNGRWGGVTKLEHTWE